MFSQIIKISLYSLHSIPPIKLATIVHYMINFPKSEIDLKLFSNNTLNIL